MVVIGYLLLVKLSVVHKPELYAFPDHRASLFIAAAKFLIFIRLETGRACHLSKKLRKTFLFVLMKNKTDTVVSPH
jgi:hypothetical protein